MSARTPAWLLFIGDAVCLSGFVLFGLRTHEMADPLARFGLTAGPLLLAWALAGFSLGAFAFSPPLQARTVWGRTLTAWLVAAPLGLILRALLLKSATLVVIFVLVTLGLGGALLLLWRSAFVWAVRRWSLW